MRHESVNGVFHNHLILRRVPLAKLLRLNPGDVLFTL